MLNLMGIKVRHEVGAPSRRKEASSAEAGRVGSSQSLIARMSVAVETWPPEGSPNRLPSLFPSPCGRG